MNEHNVAPTGVITAQPPRGFVRNRLHNFGLTMVVMGISFILYYLGLFGSVEGPLTPDNIAGALTGWGVTRDHVMRVLLSALVVALGWNWVLNAVCLLRGQRMTCKADGKDAAGFCGQPLRRVRSVSKRSGRTVVDYVCSCGHRRSEGHFHPIRKGTAANTVWMAFLAFVLITYFCP